MKRSHLNLALVIIVAGLAVAVWFGQKKDDEKKPPLTALAPAAVDKIAIEHPGSPAIRMAKQNGAWMLVAPVEAEADPFEVNALVGLADTGVQQKLTGGDLKELGLAPARYRITLNDQTLDFGGEEALKYRRYVQVNGKDIDLITDPSSAALDQDYSDLVAKNLVPTGADITRIAAPQLDLEKTADGAWSSPDHPQAKPEQLAAVIKAWKNEKSLFNAAIEPDDVKSPGVTLTLADGRTLGFNVVSRDPQLVIARPDLGVRYTLSKADSDSLLALVSTPAPAAPAAPGPADADGASAVESLPSTPPPPPAPSP